MFVFTKPGAIQLTIILYSFNSAAKFSENLTKAVFATEYGENFSQALNAPPPAKKIIFEN